MKNKTTGRSPQHAPSIQQRECWSMAAQDCARGGVKPAQQVLAAVRRADAQTDGQTREVHYADAVSYASFIDDAVTLFGGTDCGVDVCHISTCDGASLHIHGRLPPAMRKDLKRAFAWWQSPRRGWMSGNDARIVWHSTRDGRGPRFAIPSLGALLDLIIERKAFQGGRA